MSASPAWRCTRITTWASPPTSPPRAAYQAYLTRLFTLAELDQPQSRARDVLAFETRLAKIQWTNVENRDIQKTYNKLSRAELARRQPGYDWPALLSDAGLGAAEHLNPPAQLSAQAGAAIAGHAGGHAA